MRNALKTAAERLLLLGGAARVRRARLGTRALVLAYHNIVPEGEEPCGDRSLHLSQRKFAAQLDALLRTHDVVPLDSVLSPARGGAGRPRLAITFDDAYRGAVTAGIDELARRGLPATLFVAPAFVGGASFWWDSLATEVALPPPLREHVLTTLQGRDARAREWAESTGHAIRELPAHARCATADEIRGAADRPGITLGSHTWSHVNLAAVAAADYHDELVRPLAWLREHFSNVVAWLSYPYGLSSAAVQQAVAAAGYRGAVRIEGGWMPQGAVQPFHVPRIDVPAGISLEGFRLRLAGLFC